MRTTWPAGAPTVSSSNMKSEVLRVNLRTLPTEGRNTIVRAEVIGISSTLYYRDIAPDYICLSCPASGLTT
jgi:hypothetical protein